MRNKIVCLLVSFALMSNIFTCLIGFTSMTLPKPKSVLEAPIVEGIRAAIAWIIAYGGGGSGSGSTKSPMPSPN